MSQAQFLNNCLVFSLLSFFFFSLLLGEIAYNKLAWAEKWQRKQG